MTSKVSQDPTPAPGQLWKSQINGTVKTVAATSPHTTTWVGGGYDFTRTLPESYDCIGISTPAGRVMVGERRRDPLDGEIETVVYVVDGGRVQLRSEEDGHRSANASEVARWPLIFPPTSAASAHARSPRCGCSPNIVARLCPVHGHMVRPDLIEADGRGYEVYRKALADCDRAILTTICGPSADPREQGPGIAAWVPPRVSVRPDVVVCAEWDEKWGMP